MTEFPEKVINAAGKLTALGGSAQSEAVSGAQASAAGQHVDLAALRHRANREIALMTGAEAACITTGAAAGITISIAAILCEKDPDLLTQLPLLQQSLYVVLQSGHDINFGANIEQMIHLAGAQCLIAGSPDAVTQEDISQSITKDVIALLYVQSHHCIQEDRVDLDEYITIARSSGIPVIVDAAAEDDLTRYIAAGADLVTYSGGKAFSGPTTGFIAGSKKYIHWCEAQYAGIARTMKVGKEQIAGLLHALDEYRSADHAAIHARWEDHNQVLLSALQASTIFDVMLKADEAGRDFERVALSAKADSTGLLSFEPEQLVKFLSAGSPSIRTRNHGIAQNRILIDPRELHDDDVQSIADRLAEFEREILSPRPL